MHGFSVDMPFFHNPTGVALSFSLITFNETIERKGSVPITGQFKRTVVSSYFWMSKAILSHGLCMSVLSKLVSIALSHDFSMTHLSLDCSPWFQRL